MLAELPDILIDSVLAFLFVILFISVGSFFVKKSFLSLPGIGNKYGFAFYSLVFGLLIIISIYSLIVAKGITINVLVIPLLLVLVKTSRNTVIPKHGTIPYLETGVIVLLSVAVLHFLPESEYKQNDSLYYLKIAESLNRTGQENTHHYYNRYSDVFHGTDPYHYFEIWCTAFCTWITSLFRNSIDVHRYVVQSVFVTAIILGSYNLISSIIRVKLKY